MMLDIDGDGLLDRVTNQPVVAGGVAQCRAAWQVIGTTDHFFGAIL
jgi:hypothetical protein